MDTRQRYGQVHSSTVGVELGIERRDPAAGRVVGSDNDRLCPPERACGADANDARGEVGRASQTAHPVAGSGHDLDRLPWAARRRVPDSALLPARPVEFSGAVLDPDDKQVVTAPNPRKAELEWVVAAFVNANLGAVEEDHRPIVDCAE